MIGPYNEIMANEKFPLTILYFVDSFYCRSATSEILWMNTLKDG
jgi:hypothetical protein